MISQAQLFFGNIKYTLQGSVITFASVIFDIDRVITK